MPSEPSVADLPVLGRAAAPFRSALARTIEEVRTFLDARGTSPENQVVGTQASLGAFAAGRVDPVRFSALLAQTISLDEKAAERVQRAFGVLRELNERLDDLLRLSLPAGMSLRAAVGDRLAHIGRAFGAAHLVAAVRAERYDPAEHGDLLDAFPFARWGAAERRLAPPLVVDLAGTDCKAAALSDLMDGGFKCVLRVRDACPAAPLARLVTPRTFVVQTDDPASLEAFAAWEGAGIAALVPEGAARFHHDPRAGASAAERLLVAHLPDKPLRSVGGVSAAQQQEEIGMLAAWAQAAPAPADVSVGDDPAGKLAAWLLQQARLA